jgi:aspartyl-tRNA(Asn)/glutamyl-tRNA(Gln) amidotransferase subunit C
MELSDGDLKHLERLARVRLSGASRERLREQLARIIDFVRRLQEIETPGHEQCAGRESRTAQLRSDVTLPCLSKEEVLAESPECENGMFRVPPVIEADEP